ncbi:condensation domain-containing protein [Micromonospora sp. FIMYZ51]|uniref:condensation domain-containing protein n=1 Tax=Micromonospora sp. FIMYZ51 TaxID=3051832 RepID=UPI00311D67D2
MATLGARQLPASIGQRLLWMIGHHRGATLSCPLICRLSGPLDHDRLRAALAALVARHDSLRTTFTGRGHRLTQVVGEPEGVDLPVVALAGPEALPAALAAELARPLDPAVQTRRAVLWRVSATEHVLCLNLHHLITDAWSCGVLYAELRELYADRPLPQLDLTFQDIVDRQTAGTSGSGPERQRFDRQRDYWRRRLDGARILTLPAAPDADPPEAARPGLASADLSAEITARVAALAQRLRTTPFVVFLAVYYAQLAAYTGKHDVVVATLFANRLDRRTQGVVGFLATMALLRTEVRGTFADLVARTHTTVSGAFAHQELPLQLLPTAALTPAGGRVDDLVFQMMPDPHQRAHAGGIDFELVLPEEIGSRFRLELVLAPVDGGTRVLLYHHTDQFGPASAQAFTTRYATLVDSLTATPDTPTG